MLEPVVKVADGGEERDGVGDVELGVVAHQLGEDEEDRKRQERETFNMT